MTSQRFWFDVHSWPLRHNDISVSYPAKDSKNLFERKTQIGFHNLSSSERVIDAVNSVGYSSKQWHQQRVYPITTRRSLRDQPLFLFYYVSALGVHNQSHSRVEKSTNQKALNFFVIVKVSRKSYEFVNWSFALKPIGTICSNNDVHFEFCLSRQSVERRQSAESDRSYR